MRMSTGQKYAASVAVASLILVVGALSVRSARQAQHAAHWVAHTHEVIGTLEGLLGHLRDVETGQRGYVITGAPRYLEPYEAGRQRVIDDLARVRRLTADNARQQARLDSLAPVITARLAIAARVIAERRERGLGAAAAMVMSDSGKHLMDEVRRRIAALSAEEGALLRRRATVNAERERDVGIVTLVGTTLAFALVLLMTWALYQDVRARERLVAERDRSLAQERHTRQQLERIQRITDATLAPLALDELLTELMARLREVLAADAACVHLLMRDGVTLELCKCVGVSEEVEDRVHVPLGQGVVGRIAAGGAPAAVADLSREEVIDPVIAERFTSLLGAPLVVRGRVIGAAHVETVAQRDFGADELELIGLVAERAASAIERARAYQAERRSEERFRLLVAGVRDYAIFTLDADGRVASWNAGAERLLGWRADEIVGRHLETFFAPEERAAGRPPGMLRAAADSGSTRDEGWRVRSDGTRFWAEATMTALHDEDDGHLLGFANVTRDLTERRAADQALVAARETAEQARARAEEASAAKSQFLATMSHELRTPLNAVLGYVDLFELGIEGPVSEGQQHYLARMRASSRHLLSLVNEILDLAKLEARQLHVERVRASCAEAVGAALALVYPQAASRGLSVVNHCAPDATAAFIGDPHRVEQVLVNLLSNAVKFTEPGGRLTVTCEMTQHADPRARLGDGDEWCRISIEDTGIGIHPSLLATIFEPFVQAQEQTTYTRTQGGAGLGLAISRRLARLMGGDVTASSEPGRGSVFTLWLPAAPDASRATWDAASDGTEGDLPTRGERRPHVAPFGALLRAHVDEVARRVSERLRGEAGVPSADTLTGAQLEDHTTSLVAAIAQSLVMADEARGGGADLVRDGRDIQRLIAERHGAQRRMLGWTEDMVRRGFTILAETIVDVLVEASGGTGGGTGGGTAGGVAGDGDGRGGPHHHRADATLGPDVREAIALVERLVERATEGALRGHQLAVPDPPPSRVDGAP